LLPAEARREALIRMGGPEQDKRQNREARGLPFLEFLLQDLRFGVRMLRKSPGFTVVAVLTLALGIGANTAIFSLIDAVLLRMLPVDEPQSLLQLKIEIPRRPTAVSGGFTNPLWEQIRNQQDVFSSVFAWSEGRFDLAQGGAVHLAHGIWVSGSFFNALRLRPAAGRLIATSDDYRGCPAVTVLSYSFWHDHYGGADTAIGSTLLLDRHPFQVIGATSPGFYSMDQGEKFDVAVPICAATIFDGRESRLDRRSPWWLQVAGRMKPGIPQAQIIARLRTLSPALFAAALPQDWSPDGQRDSMKRMLTAVPVATGSSQFGLLRRFEQPLVVLMAVVGLVMLIACANLASLMLARAAGRHKEIAVRKALGASRMRLISQLMTESVLLSLTGALFGILFARWAAALLVRYISISSEAFFVDPSLDVRVLGFTATVAVLTSILFGLLPALQSTRVPLTSAMKGSQVIEMGRPLRFRTRKWVVASQVALSLVLVVVAGLLLRSFAKLATLDLGFDRNNVLLVGMNLSAAKVPTDQQLATYEAIETRLRAVPGVVSVGRSMITPMEGGAWSQIIKTDWSKALTDEEAQSGLNSISPGFFETLHTPLLEGRDFRKSDTKSTPMVAIINQTLARRFFPGLNPIGGTFQLKQISGQFGPPIEVVGLVNDAKYESIREAIHPTAFFPDTQLSPDYSEAENFEVRTVIRPSALVLSVQAAVASVNKEIPLEFATLTDQVNHSIIRERLLALLSGFFGGLALLLAMIGLYGTLSYVVSQRQVEFGIRMAVGAQPGSILLLVIKDVLLVLCGGIAIGVGVALATVRVLQGLLYGLPPRDPITLAAAACILSVVAFIAGYLPARRAAGADPIVALRHE
jgi:predicted permease